MAARHPCGGSQEAGWLLGAALVGGGILLFLDNIGVLSLRTAWNYWPLALAVAGVYKLSYPRRRSDTMFAAVLIVFGVLFTLIQTGAIPVKAHNGSWTVSLLLILAGTRALQVALDRNSSSVVEQRVSTDLERVHDYVVGSGLKRRFDDIAFRGGEVHCFMGETVYDLRRALRPEHNVMVVEAHVLFGAVRLLVPEHWAVKSKGSGVFGVFQDKTIGSRVREGELAPTLVVTGFALFGAVEIEN